MELYVFCMVSLLVLATVVVQGIYCFMYCSYPLPGGADPCPMVACLRRKKRKPRQRSNSAEVMISMEDVKPEPQTPSPMPTHEYKTRGGQTDV
ncbi:uncharacterized protein LOC115332140 [Ixodes scapularis]|uniref:uncharacterized protein LOC115332140 n=1 Tax=Ixodes scapularis TaxID=6945 RepID=UPI0011619640|nr:uncharacterized protein LOC115332140 [Ixodes scapularis]